MRTTLLLIFATLSVVTRARADDAQPAALSWVRGAGAPECASARELAEQIEAQLGRAIFVPPVQAGIAIEGSIERSEAPAGFVVRIGLIERGDAVSATRVLVLPPVPCRELDPLLVFILAAMLDPDAPLLPPRLPAGLSDATRALLTELFKNEPTVPPLSLAAPNPNALHASAAPTPPKLQPSAAKPSADAQRPAAPQPRLALFTVAGGALGLLPAVAPIGALELRWRFDGAWLLRAGGSYWFARAVAPTSSSQASFSGEAVNLALCPAPLWRGSVPGRVCAGATLGRLASSVHGVIAPLDPARFYAAAVLAADVSWSPIHGFWLRGGLGGTVALTRDRFFVQDAQGNHVAHRPSLFGAQLDLGLGVALF